MDAPKNLHSVVVSTDDIDTEDAIEELITQSLRQLAGAVPKAGLIYFGIETDTALVSERLLNLWPDLQLVGSSTWGEISPDHGFTEDGMVLCLLYGDDVAFSTAYFDAKSAPDAAQLEKLFTSPVDVKGELDGDNASVFPKLSLLITDIVFFRHTELLLEKLGDLMPDTLFFGGAAADAWEFKEVKQLCGRETLGTGCVFLNIYGDVKVSTAVDSGWDAMGKRGVVTRSEGHVCYEIDNKPALNFYSEGFSQPLMPKKGELPICLYDEQGNRLFLRTCFGEYDAEAGSISFLGNIPEGATAELSTITQTSMVRGVSESVAAVLKSYEESNTKPALALFSSCAARRVIFGTNVNKETGAIREVLPKDIPFLGFYTYGEICRSHHEGSAVFHNQTFAALLVG